MSKEEKDAQIIDLNLFSGSSDTMRANLGGIFEIVNVDEVSELTLSPFFGGGVYETTIRSGEGSEWKEFDDLNLVNLFFDRTYRSGPEDDPHTPAVPVSDDTVIPTFKFPIRLYGKEDQITNSNQWEIILMGGTYGDIPYPTIYNESVWDDYWFETGFPYTKQEVNSLVDGSTVTSISQITYDYNHYLREYQDYASTLNSELLIPNMYLVEMFNLPSDIAILYIDTALTEDVDFLSETVTPTGRVFDQTMRDFVSLEGTTSDLDVLLSDVDVVWVPAPTFLIGPDDAEGAVTAWEGISDHKLHGYLSQSVPMTYLSASTRGGVENMLQNIYFDQYSRDAQTETYSGTPKPNFVDMETTKGLFPYYINISFPKVDTSTYVATKFGMSLTNNDFSSKFLKSLKEVFNNESTSLIPEEKEYVLSLDYQSASIDGDIDTTVQSAQNSSFRAVDYFKLLTYSYENYASTSDNEYFVGEKTIHREAAIDKTGVYRYINSDSVLGVIEDAVDFVSDSDNFSIDSLDDLYNFGSKHNEVLAYRIEKIGGPPTGDSQTQNVLQNYWIINSLEKRPLLVTGDINFFDSQVKYDKDYTYNIYAYILSAGVKYQTSDLRITKVINEIEGYTDADGTYIADPSWCVQFYDPDTGEAADPLWEIPAEPEEGEVAPPSSVLTISEDAVPPTPYLADFYVNVEPSLQIFEVPFASKTLRVLDNPTNQLSIKPFQVLDASQTIGYYIDYETFVEESYPSTISSADETLKLNYLNARDLLETDAIDFESISQQRYVEVYRLSEMPNGFEDFENNLISTIDLQIKDSNFTLPNTIMYDMIKTNQKYYYVFRVLNENFIPGHLSEIYEAELIDDGGYIYSNFDIFFEEDFKEDIFVNPSIALKKLLQLQPNMSQITFNDSIVDYDSTAALQLNNMSLGNADSLIWDKTFKIRLTSKKTGKKIDLNVTYKYEHDSN